MLPEIIQAMNILMAYRTAFLGSTPNNSFLVMWTGVCLGKG